MTASVFKNDISALRDSLSQGVDANELDTDGRTPLIHAAIDGKLDAARLLIEAGADVNIQDSLGCSALHYAAQNHFAELALLLANRGAMIDVEDNNGNTPLSTAVLNSKGRGELISVLLMAGADREHANKYDQTPLGLAKLIANYDVAQFLER